MNGNSYVKGEGQDSESVGISSKQNTVINHNKVKKEETVKDTASKVTGINIASKTKNLTLCKHWILRLPLHAIYICTFFMSRI